MTLQLDTPKSRGSRTIERNLQAPVTLPGAGLRVVHLAKYYPPASGGIESHVRTLAQHQARLGCSVDVVAVNHLAKNGEEVTFDHFRRTRSRIDRDANVRVHRLGRQFTVARFDGVARLIPRLKRIASGGESCVWHLHTPNITMSIAALLTKFARPLVITHHSDIVRQKRLASLVMPMLNAVYRRSDAIYATSPPYFDGSEMLQRHASRCHCIPLGVDLAPYRYPNAAALAYAEELRRTHPGPRWLTVGRMVYYKGLRTAIEALKSTPGTLLCIGGGPQLDSLKEYAQHQGVADRIEWLGRVSDDQLAGAYQAASALWMPSSHKAEAFGLVQVEAMASGCPVINTDIVGSGVPWVCPDEETGLTIAVNDPQALSNAANRLLTETGLRDRLSTRAQTMACQRFSAEIMAEQMLQSYREVLAKASKG